MTSITSLQNRIGTIGGFIVRHPVTILLAWSLIILSAIPSASRVKERLIVAGVVKGGEATAVDSVLASEFSGISRNVLLLVIGGAQDALGEPIAEIADTIKEIETVDFVSRIDWRKKTKSPLVSADYPASSYLAVHLEASQDPMTALQSLRSLTQQTLREVRQTHPSATMQWTGDSAIKEAIITSSNEDLRRSELRVLPLTFLLLLFAFRSLTAAVLPLIFGVLAILLTLASASILAEHMTLSVMVQSVATLLGLALGIDYALLMMTRFREVLPSAESSAQAALITLRKSGKTVIISGSAVAIGFAGLTLVPVDQMRSIAYAGLLVALFSVLLAITLVPAVLALLGPFLEFGSVSALKNRMAQPTRLNRWAHFVCRHPLIVLIISSLPLFALAFSSQQMSSSFPGESWLPAHTEPVKALRAIENMSEGNIVKRLQILYRLNDGDDIMGSKGSRALRRLHSHLIKDDRSHQVRSIFSYSASSLSLRALTGRIPDEVLRHYISTDGSIALLELIPYSELDQKYLSILVKDLRNMNVEEVTGQPGGLPAAAVDYEEVIKHWFPFVVAVVSLGSFLVLAIAFRSLLVPLKAVALNLLAVLAAYGALVLVFIEGYGANILGLVQPIEAVFPPTPVLVFCAAFGISMDYEVFLISRIAEARRRNPDNTAAIVEGLTRTGNLITSAAAIMVVVFGAFAFGNILPTQILGFSLAVVVALDAVLIRMALGPAMIRLAGRFNWWPGS